MKKLKYDQKFITFGLIAVFALFGLACQQQPVVENTNTADTSASAPARTSSEPVPGMQSPTETYRKLYSAVKSKNSEDIKMVISKQTLTLAQGMASQQKTTIEDAIRNGFTATTFADTLPEIRDERIKENMGAIEVWNAKDNKWDDLPFIYEDGGWRLAIGDIFSGAYEKPSQGLAELESNTNQMKPAAPTNGNPFQNSNRIMKPPAANSNR